MKAALLLLALLQDGDAIQREISRITEKDPKESFDAVSNLADIGALKGEEVRKALAAMPAALSFWREAALEEMRVRATLGERYRKPTRVRMKWQRMGTGECIKDINAQLKTPWLNAVYALPGVWTVDEEATLMQALDKLLDDRLTLTPGRPIDVWDRYYPGPARQVYRNTMVDLASFRVVREVRFGVSATHELAIGLALWWEPGLDIVRVTPDRVEIRDDRDRTLALLPTEARPDVVATGAVTGFGHLMHVRSAPPASDAESIAVVRGSFRVALSVASETIDAVLRKGALVSGNLAEVEIATGIPVTVRVRTKRPDMPVAFRVKLTDGTEALVSGDGKRSGDAVVYDVVIPGLQDPRRPAPGRTPALPEVASLSVVVHGETFERRVYFDFRDIRLR